MLLVLSFVSITKLWGPKTGVVRGLNGNQEDANTDQVGCLVCRPKQWKVEPNKTRICTQCDLSHVCALDPCPAQKYRPSSPRTLSGLFSFLNLILISCINLLLVLCYKLLIILKWNLSFID